MRVGFRKEIQWDSYARSYDFLARNNPSYSENVEMVSSLYDGLILPNHANVVDLGAGTGNFIARLAQDHPDHSFVHLDASEEMVQHAAIKYRRLGLRNVTLVSQSALDFDPGSKVFDVAVCVNALYAIVPQRRLLERVRQFLKPEGRFIVIDFGRPQRVLDWGRFLIESYIKEHGLIAGIGFAAKGIGALVENARGASGQKAGNYWLHSTDEFRAMLSNSGFTIDQSGVCYRGYCDWAVCRPKEPVHPSPSP